MSNKTLFNKLSNEASIQKCNQAFVRMHNVPRWHPDPELVKKYNLIEFL